MMPPLSQAFVRNLMYPVYRGLRHDHVLAVIRDLKKNQWTTPEEFADRRWQHMKTFLREISTNVPYYRDLFRRTGLHVEDIREPADLLNLPFLTKEDIRGAGASMITEDPGRTGVGSNTGGSTGEPLYFYCDASSGPIRRAVGVLGYGWGDIDIGDRIAYMWGFHLDKPLKERVIRASKSYFNNKLELSSFNLSQESMEKYAKMLGTFKPDAIDSYPSVLAVFADFCKNQGISNIKPRAIFLSGERTYPYQGEVIQEVFGCPMFNRYGSNEFSIIAQDCERHEGLHLLNPSLYLEVIHESGRPAASGEIGEVVMTDLANLYMPFLRYRTGDLAVPTIRQCSCGRGSPLLDRIEGRVFNVVVTADGRSAGGAFWTYLSRFVPGIKQFQIEQNNRNGVVFRIVRGPDWRNEFTRRLELKIKDNLGERFKVDFEFVDDIPRTPAGKFRFIWSRIEERLVVKSKIHKARITGSNPDGIEGIVIDDDLLHMSSLAPFEKVLVVDNANGARVETCVIKGRKGSGEIVISGAGTHHIKTGDEVIIMAFAWSDEPESTFKNILVDENNRFVRYLVEVAGEKL
jgi:phenylacetate-CoA ligase